MRPFRFAWMDPWTLGSDLALAVLALLSASTATLRAQMTGATTEDNARALVAEYYETMDVLRVHGDHGECTGVSLQDCFGGDPECVHSHVRQILRAYLCTDPEFLHKRAELLDRLDSLGALMPESDWLAGQRVYLAWKNEGLERAQAIADGCGGTPSWCQALRGFVRHRRVPGSGEAQLDSALANAPRETYASVDPLRRPPPRWLRGGPLDDRELSVSRPGLDRGLHCEWTDLTPLLIAEPIELSGRVGARIVYRDYRTPAPGASELLAEYRSLPCGGGHAFEERFWWLADPLWSVEGNERRSEHLVRNIQRRLRDEILLRDEDGLAYGWLHTEMIAMGPPNSWGGGYGCDKGSSRRCDNPALGKPPSDRPIAMFSAPPKPYVNGGYSFAPDLKRFRDPIASTPEDWALTWNEGAERMVTRETWYNLEHYQSAMLRRGGRLLALAASRLPVIVSSFDSVRAALALGRPADLHAEVSPATVERNGVVRSHAEVEEAEWMMSLEMLGPDWRGRARHGARAPELREGFGLSQPVLVDERFERDSVPLAETMLPSTTITARVGAGVYFEVYGAAAGEPLGFAVSVVSLDSPSLLGRVARALRLSAGASLPVVVEWSEPAEVTAPDRMARHIGIDFGALENGTYDLVVTVRRTDGTEASSSRRIRMERSG